MVNRAYSHKDVDNVMRSDDKLRVPKIREERLWKTHLSRPFGGLTTTNFDAHARTPTHTHTHIHVYLYAYKRTQIYA